MVELLNKVFGGLPKSNARMVVLAAARDHFSSGLGLVEHYQKHRRTNQADRLMFGGAVPRIFCPTHRLHTCTTPQGERCMYAAGNQAGAETGFSISLPFSQHPIN